MEPVIQRTSGKATHAVLPQVPREVGHQFRLVISPDSVLECISVKPLFNHQPIEGRAEDWPPLGAKPLQLRDLLADDLEAVGPLG